MDEAAPAGAGGRTGRAASPAGPAAGSAGPAAGPGEPAAGPGEPGAGEQTPTAAGHGLAAGQRGPVGRRPALWHCWLAGAAASVAGCLSLPYGDVKDVASALLGLVYLLVFAWAVRRHASGRAPWWLLLTGVSCLLVGDVIYTGYHVVLGRETPFPSVADAAYLAAYPLMALGLLRLVRARTGGADRGSLIDATILAVSAGVLSWVFLMAPYASDRTTALPIKLITLAYPLGDLLLIGVLARLVLLPGRGHPAVRLLAVGLVGLVAADTAYAVTVLHGTYEQGGVIDAGFLGWYVFAATAAMHPRVSELTEPVAVQHQRLSPPRLAVLAAASLLPPLLLAVQAARSAPLELPAVIAATVALFLLVLVRMAGLVHEVDDAGRALAGTLEELRAAQAERRGLLDRTLRAGEEERKRLAAELHDGPIQRLTGLGYPLDRAVLAAGREDLATVHELLTQLQSELTGETRALRKVMAALRPPVLEERGLVRAVQDHLREFAVRTGVRVDAELDVDRRIDPEVETALFRVVQEATRNVEKHAEASALRVALVPHQRGIRLQVADDGRGFDPGGGHPPVRDGHYGLVGMRERVEMAGGTWRVDSSPGAGTTLSATLAEEVST